MTWGEGKTTFLYSVFRKITQIKQFTRSIFIGNLYMIWILQVRKLQDWGVDSRIRLVLWRSASETVVMCLLWWKIKKGGLSDEFNNTPERISETSLEKYQCSAWMRWGSISTIKQKNFKKASNTQNLIYDHISIYYQNCREFNSNTHSIYKYVLKSDHRISAITEIWLRDGESNSKLFPENYLVYRGDRSYGVRGAGVLLAVNDDFCTSRWC